MIKKLFTIALILMLFTGVVMAAPNKDNSKIGKEIKPIKNDILTEKKQLKQEQKEFNKQDYKYGDNSAKSEKDIKLVTEKHKYGLEITALDAGKGAADSHDILVAVVDIPNFEGDFVRIDHYSDSGTLDAQWIQEVVVKDGFVLIPDVEFSSIIVDGATGTYTKTVLGADVSDFSTSFVMSSPSSVTVSAPGVVDGVLYENGTLQSGTAARTLPNATWVPVVSGEADLLLDPYVPIVEGDVSTYPQSSYINGLWEFVSENDYADTSLNNNTLTASGITWDNTSRGILPVFNEIGTELLYGSTNTPIIGNYDNYTISMWVYPKNAPSGTRIFVKGAYYCSYQSVSATGTTLRYKHDMGAGTDANVYTDEIPFDTWSHVVITYNEDNDNKLKSYTNSEYESSSGAGVGTSFTDTQVIYIGSDTGTLTLNGSVDDLGIWGTALSPTEVSQLYHGNTSYPHTTAVEIVDSTGTATDTDVTITGLWTQNTALEQESDVGGVFTANITYIPENNQTSGELDYNPTTSNFIYGATLDSTDPDAVLHLSEQIFSIDAGELTAGSTNYYNITATSAANFSYEITYISKTSTSAQFEISNKSIAEVELDVELLNMSSGDYILSYNVTGTEIANTTAASGRVYFEDVVLNDGVYDVKQEAEPLVNPVFVAATGVFASAVFVITSWINRRRKRW